MSVRVCGRRRTRRRFPRLCRFFVPAANASACAQSRGSVRQPVSGVVGRHWFTVVSPRIGSTDIREVVAALRWPAWIADVGDELRRVTHEVFNQGTILVVRPLTDEAVAQLRVVAAFFEFVGRRTVGTVAGEINRAICET
jgi:hypothetical protein